MLLQTRLQLAYGIRPGGGFAARDSCYGILNLVESSLNFAVMFS
jgi:hypothetical protein